MTAVSRPGTAASSARKLRPSIGSIPSSGNRFGVTDSPSNRSASLSVVTVKFRERKPATLVEGFRLALQIQQIRIGQPGVVPVLCLQAVRRVQGDDAIAAIAKRQRTQQQRIDDAEDRDVGANADGQRDERGQREARALT